MVRKFTKSKSIFPTDDAIRKVVYMSVSEISKKWTMPVRDWGLCPQTPGVYPPEDTGEVEKQRISSADLHRISCSCVGALSSVALFRCIFSFGMFFGFIRVYTVIFSDPVFR